ncbi:F-box domain [Dillenia turbinata]|uniref:F-box domain n=1 Tax=Dillenia turbinata TaxID=194707 RepID=A0AAN8UQX0_9MAGN
MLSQYIQKQYGGIRSLRIASATNTMGNACLGILGQRKEHSSPIFPDVIILEILSWLPVKKLLQLKCVCKHWFRPLLISIRGRKMKETTIFLHACDGLFLQRGHPSKKYRISNPSTRQRMHLPDPKVEIIDMKLSCVPSTGDYKVVHFANSGTSRGRLDKDNLCEVLDLGRAFVSWRPLALPKLLNLDEKPEVVSVVSTGAVVHCIRLIKVKTKLLKEVLSLDMDTECFTSTIVAQGFFLEWGKVRAIDWEGYLAFAAVVDDHLVVLVLEDHKRHKWSEKPLIVSLMFLTEDKKTEEVVPLMARNGLVVSMATFDLLWQCIGNFVPMNWRFNHAMKTIQALDTLFADPDSADTKKQLLVKELLRLKCTGKHWYALIEDPFDQLPLVYCNQIEKKKANGGPSLSPTPLHPPK